MENKILEEQLAKFITQCLYKGISIHDVSIEQGTIIIHFTDKHYH